MSDKTWPETADRTECATPKEVDDRIDLWHRGGCPADWSLPQAIGIPDRHWGRFMMGEIKGPDGPLPEIPREEKANV